MQRLSAGSYSQIIQGVEYYVVKLPSGAWSVGVHTSSGSSHIEDFAKYRHARNYILRQVERAKELQL